ncbi:hypothetical protein [Flavobacterium sp.]|uniref:hypothetical protein n=1 Tax=Flavobacterium sp. TaxID=239 RepID=UPI002CDF1A76|nr:hypothetical protein [Flavobacterium sp.]HSD05615.1 hypothetical protein [Flavobacterium sp.]
MKILLFVIMIAGISVEGFAQDEFSTKNNAIPNKNMDIKEVPPLEVIPPKNETPPPPAVVKKPDPFEINPVELFNNRQLYKEPKDSVGIYYRRNQYLGSFKTKEFISTIRFRDAAFVDGDKVRIYLNDKVIEPEVVLDGGFKEYKITLKPGINKIDFEALNEGFASPNTAEFQIFDAKGAEITSQEWNVGTGYKAAVIIVNQ